MKRKVVLFMMLSLSGVNLFGQHEMTLFHMNNVFQGSYVNPTLVPENKVSIGIPLGFFNAGIVKSDQGTSSYFNGRIYTIPSVYFGVYAPFRANDLKEQTGGSSVFSLANAIKKMSANKNLIGANASAELFHLGFKVRNLYVSLSANTKTDFKFNVPKNFLDLVWNGNAQYIGSAANLDNTELNFNQYNEYALGITRSKDGGKFVYGVRLKLLQGLNNFYTEKSKAEVAVNSEYYQHTLSADYLARSSSVLPYDTAIVSDDYINGFKNFKNLGWGADVGISYSPSKKFTFTGALNNIGAITWKTNVKSHTINGTYEFNGIKLDDLLEDESLGIAAIADSLQSSFNVQNISTEEKYKTSLAPILYLSGAYNLGRSTKISITGSSEFYRGIRPIGSVALVQRIGRIFNVVVSYNVRKQSYNNMGIGLMMKPGPFQFFLVTDHVPFNVFNTNNVNLRAGMNLVFGKTRKPEMQTHNED